MCDCADKSIVCLFENNTIENCIYKYKYQIINYNDCVSLIKMTY